MPVRYYPLFVMANQQLSAVHVYENMKNILDGL